MAQKKQSPDNPPPSSLPPLTAGIDLNWDDDVASARVARQPPSDEVDPGDRITAVPDIPMSELNARLLAEAERAADQPPSLVPTRPGVSAGAARQAGSPRPLPVTVVPAQASALPPLPAEPPPLLALDQPGLTPDSWPVPTDAYRRTEPVPPSLDEVGHEERSRRPPLATSSADSSESDDADPGKPMARERLHGELRDRYAVGDFSGALEIAERLLGADAQDAPKPASNSAPSASQAYS